MITVTAAAVSKIENDAAQNNSSGMALRLAVRQEESGTLHYGMGFDEAREEDVTFTFGSLNVIFDPEFIEVLKGATLDYVEMEPGQFNFIFINPNDSNCTPPASGSGCSSGSCGGCGS